MDKLIDEIDILSPKDIWKKVVYKAFCVWENEEEWVIKNFNNKRKVAFVVYKCNNDWSNYQNYTWCPTNYCDLHFKN